MNHVPTQTAPNPELAFDPDHRTGAGVPPGRPGAGAGGVAERPIGGLMLALLLANLALAAGSWAQVPMVPVPMTLQTFVVPLVGALLGARWGTFAVLLWLAEAACGAPVLAGGGSLAAFAGPTAGYLFAFPVVAWAVGRASERGLLQRVLPALAVMLAANAACLLLGGLWLAQIVGPSRAWAVGVMPFLLGGALKSALAVATLGLVRRTGR